MHRSVRWLVATAVLWSSAVAGALAQPAAFTVGPPAPWVDPLDLQAGPATPAERLDGGVEFVLLDHQVALEGRDRVRYYRYAARAATLQGVEELAHVEVQFDPSYQTLTLHAINVIRDGRVLPRLQAGAVRILQRERELSRRIFDGSVTANVFLEDVRAGDIIDVAYTLRGSNPVFGDRHAGMMPMQWSTPVQQARLRLLWPKERPLAVSVTDPGIQPVMSERQGRREIRLERKAVPAVRPDPGSPPWHQPHQLLQWTEYPSWNAVARWGVSLYPVPDKPSAAIAAQIEALKRQAESQPARLVAALRFVQREIRYMGVEAGISSHKPSRPEEVLQRRFGDCKDKTLLLVALLRGMGIDAAPALVNTREHKAIGRLAPSPIVFDHVIVRATLAGKVYWLDPTRFEQLGSLEHVYQPDFGLALVVDARSERLVPMESATPRINARDIRVALTPDDHDGKTTLEVRTVHRGAAADGLRAHLSTVSLAEQQKNYLNFYASYYPGMQSQGPLEVKSDERTNEVIVVERYRLPNIWKESKGLRQAEIMSPDLVEVLRKPNPLVRNAPLGLTHPMEVSHRVELLLPEAPSVEPQALRVSDDAFTFERRTSRSGFNLVLSDRFTSLRDHVPVDAMQKYAENLGHALDALDYTVQEPAKRADGTAAISWPVLATGVLSLGLFGALALRLYRYDPAPVASDEPVAFGEQGIGGWLVLAAISILVAPLVALAAFAQIWPALQWETWVALTTPGSISYSLLSAAHVLFAVFANTGLVILGVLLIVLFFRKRSSLPRVIVGVYAFAIAAALLDIALMLAAPGELDASQDKVLMTELRQSVVLALWIAYFLRSRRVALTFVNRLRRQVSVPAGVTEQPGTAGGVPAA